MQCPNCRATVADDARWCPQCFARFDEVPVEENEASMAQPGFAHPETYRSPPSSQWSRWKASETTFGPVGRIALSLSLLIPFYLFFTAGVMGFVGMAIWVFIIMPAALRSIWKRTRLVDPPND